uniref:Uncharacterized protein n=1 Tax=Staphylococcus phage UHP46 TaxID=3234966 RepID=A0AB39C7S9_9CAUD
MKLNFETNIAEGTPEELVEYLRLVEEGEKNSGKLSVDEAIEEAVEEEEVEPTDLKVGDKVKVLVSAFGAEGEATVTAVFESGRVELAGTSSYGTYLTNWASNVAYLEKIEDEDLDPEEADELLGYRYWYLEGTNNQFVVLEVSNGYFEDSRGKRYTHQAVSSHVKPIDREDAHVKFDFAERKGALLSYYPTVDIFQISY